MKPLYIAYECESAYGKAVRKLVICDNEDEYRQIKAAIEFVEYPVLTISEVIMADQILHPDA